MRCAPQLTAVVTLTLKRADRLLRQIREFTGFALRWVGAYQSSFFDNAATFVYARSLHLHVPPNDFIVVDPSHVRLLHAGVAQPSLNVMPGAVTWSALDFDDRFIVTTIELEVRVISRIARGSPLKVGDTGAGVGADMTTQPLFVKHPDWMRPIN